MLNYIIKSKNKRLMSIYDENYFPMYLKEYNFIKNHLNKYKTIPDIDTVQESFPNFNVLDVKESEKYLQDKLFEDYSYNKAAEIINNSNKLFVKDSRAATTYIVQNLMAIKPPHVAYGVDIIKTAQNRYEKLLDKINSDREKYIFSTGLPELDLVIDGLLRGEELLVLFARTNNGKSWIAEKIATSVWSAGYNVGFFSPEMSADSIGYRFDTLFKNFDNKGVNGNKSDFDINKYSSYIKSLSKHKNTFDVTIPESFDKRVTVSKISDWIDEKKLDLVVIDGITYMTNERGHKNEKETDKLTAISEDLMQLSVEKGVPIIVVVQANRTGARDSDGEVSNEAPELDTIRNSDGIAHNASKAISIRQNNGVLTLKITKNRNGLVGNKLMYNWDINTGVFTYLPNPKANIPGEVNEQIAEENRNQYQDEEEIF
jgi:replicative DNA helicase